jgi:hypothetical protein
MNSVFELKIRLQNLFFEFEHQLLILSTPTRKWEQAKLVDGCCLSYCGIVATSGGAPTDEGRAAGLAVNNSTEADEPADSVISI